MIQSFLLPLHAPHICVRSAAHPKISPYGRVREANYFREGGIFRNHRRNERGERKIETADAAAKRRAMKSVVRERGTFWLKGIKRCCRLERRGRTAAATLWLFSTVFFSRFSVAFFSLSPGGGEMAKKHFLSPGKISPRHREKALLSVVFTVKTLSLSHFTVGHHSYFRLPSVCTQQPPSLFQCQ